MTVDSRRLRRPHNDPRFVYRLNGFMQGVSFGAFGLVAVVWWVVDLEFSPLRLIVLGTVMEAMVLLSESPTGVIADVYSRKWSIVVSWVIMGTAQVLTPISELLPVILVWQALWGFGYTFQSGADTAWVTDEIGEEDDSLIMSKAATMAVGVIVGILGAMVVTRWSVTAALSASGVVALGFAAWLAVRMPESGFTPVDRSQRSVGSAMLDTWRRGFVLVRRVRVTRILIIATVIVSMVNELVDRLDFLRMRELGFPDLDGAGSTLLFGGVWIFMTLLGLPIMIYFSRRTEMPTDRRSAVLMVALFALAALGIAFMAANFFFLALLGWVMRDVFRELVEPVGEAWFNRYAESDIRATVISFRTQSMAFGEIFGGVCLGVVAEILSVRLAFLVGAALMAFAAVQVSRLLRVEISA